MSMAKQISLSTRNAQKRALIPAGRSSSRMPSGVSAATTESSTRLAGKDAGSRRHDNRVGDAIVQALLGITENEEHVDEREDHRDPQQRGYEISQPEDPAQRGTGTIRAHHFDTQQFLGNALAIA